MPQLQAYLIHHHDPARQPQRQAIGLLLQQLGIPLTAISEQPPLHPLPSGWRGRWLVLRGSQARLAADFAQRRLRQPERRGELLAREAWVRCKQLLQLLGCAEEQLASAWRQLQVEIIVSAKHAQAWQLALQAGGDAALIFEDDVAVTAASLPRFEGVIQALPQLLQRYPQLFCDLAGGYPLEQVVPLHLALPSMAPIEWLLPGVHTNTACSYLVSRPLLQAWQRAEQRRPGLVRFPIDHRINRVSAFGAADAVSAHWRKPPFRHGSFCGLARSWQQ
jgi:hypothetical protein